MKYLILTYYYKPDFCAGSFRSASLTKEMQENDTVESTIVLTTQPQRYGLQNEFVPYEKRGKITIIRFKNITHSNIFIKQIIAFLIYSLQSIFTGIKLAREYKIIFVTSSRLGSLILGYLLACLLNKPLYVDIRDVFSSNIRSILSKNSITDRLSTILHAVEIKIINRATWVNFVSPGFKSYFSNELLDGKTHLFSNGVDDIFIKNRKILHKRQRQTSNELKIVYAGNIGYGQGLETIIPPLAKHFNNRIKFLIIGDGSSKSLLEAEINKHGLKNIKIIPPLKRDQLLRYYNSADILFIHLADVPAFQKVLPSKLFEYGSFDIPILAGVRGVTKIFIKENISHSYVFDPGDANKAIDHINSIINDNSKINRETFVLQYNRTVLMSKMVKSMQQYSNV